jgi:hypothetical protein
MVRMHTQLSSVAHALLFWIIVDLLSYFTCTIDCGKFESIWKGSHHVYSAETLSERYYQLQGLFHVPFSVRDGFFRCELDSLMIHQERKSKLIQSYNVVPVARLLCLKD